MPIPSSSQKRKIIGLVSRTQVFLESMRDTAIYADEDDAQEMAEYIRLLDAEQKYLLSIETMNITQNELDDYINMRSRMIQQYMTKMLENEIKYLKKDLAEAENMVNTMSFDVEGGELDDFEVLINSGIIYNIDKELTACSKTLSKLTNDFDNVSIQKIYNMRSTIKKCYEELDFLAESYNIENLDLLQLAIPQHTVSLNLFSLSSEAIAHQLLNIDIDEFDDLIDGNNQNFNILLEANGKEYLDAMEKYVKFLPKEAQKDAKERCQCIKRNIKHLKKYPSDTLEIESLLNNETAMPMQTLNTTSTQQANKGDGAAAYIKILINNLDTKYYDKLKFYNGDNSKFKADFLQDVALLVKKYDSRLSNEDKAGIWQKAGMSKVAGYHRVGLSGTATYFKWARKTTEAMKFCENIAKATINNEAIDINSIEYRGNKYTDMQSVDIEQDYDSKYISKI